MGKTKLVVILGGLLVMVLTAMLLLILRLGDGMERTLLCVCWVVSLLVFLWLIVRLRRISKDYTFLMQRYEEDMSANSDELANKVSEIASCKAKIDMMTHELDRLGRLNANYEGMVSLLRRETGGAQDKLNECCKLLADVRERAEQSDKMKASFLANVAHELRTPLNSVLGYGAIINNPSISEERRRHFMMVLQKSCDRFLDTLNDILYYSQLQSGDIKVVTSVFEMDAMLVSLRTMVNSKIKESGKDIKFVLDNDMTGKGYICGFEAGYYKILSILLDNAVKFTNEGGEFDAVAGHSLGEYAALVLSGAVDMRTGYTLIKHRAACMDKAAKKNGGSMSAILGLPAETVEEVCAEVREAGDYVVPVNYNTKVQTVIAGSDAAVAKAAELLKAKGAKRAVPLAVAAAFHSEYMKEAGIEFRELIKDIPINTPVKAFYSNVTGGRLTDFSDIHDIMSRHIYSPVRFTSELAAMQAAGIDRFVECGPGKALTGMVKKTLDGVTAEATDA